MIVGSLLLILVAVTLLILGLAAGSSTLLTSSIVTSLLAAVALVVGARHAAGIRRAQGSAREPLAVDLDDDPGPVAPIEEPVGRRVDRDADDVLAPDLVDPDGVAPGAADTEVFHQDAVFSQDAGDPGGPDLSEDPDPAEDERSRTPGLAGLRFSPDAGDSGRLGHPRPVDAAAGTESSRTGVDPDVASMSGVGPPDDRHTTAFTDPGDGPDGVPPFDADRPTTPRRRGASDLPGSSHSGAPDGFGSPGGDDPGSGRGGEPHADFDRAQSVIGAARAQDTDDSAALRHEPLVEDDYSAEDPADEPPVQRIQPDEAVRVARMPTEVVVVDGRPRYHLADCPHLVDRSIEQLPVAEVVELGFTPCGLCRPVDRLVAKPARR